MLRLLGCVLVFGGACFWGWRAAQRQRESVLLLQNLIDGLEEMAQEMCFRITPLPEILQAAGRRLDGSVGLFFLACGREAVMGERAFAEIWKSQSRSLEKKLDERAMECLLRLGHMLGRYDWQEQVRLLAAAEEELKGILQERREESRRNGRLYQSLGAAMGGILVILLL